MAEVLKRKSALAEENQRGSGGSDVAGVAHAASADAAHSRAFAEQQVSEYAFPPREAGVLCPHGGPGHPVHARHTLHLPVAYDERRYGFYYTEEVKQFPTVKLTSAERIASLKVIS